MAEKSGFFNARLVAGEYDRKYNANDYADNLALVVGNGVLRSVNDDLKVTASGMIPTVAVGRAWINGHYYLNDAPLVLTAVTAPTGGNRWDRVMLRLDKSLAQRRVYVVYVQGTAGNTPVKPAPTRSGDIYELVLADVYVAANASSIVVTDTRSDNTICGWTYSVVGDGSFFTSLDNSFNEWFAGVRNTLSSVTLFKRYNWRTVLAAAGSQVSFNIPQYDADTCFIEVYVNGILETLTTDYTISGTIITFAGSLIAGTEVEVKAYKSIDGTGIMTVADEITELQQQYATLNGISKFTYKCTGLNDNVSLSQIAQAFYNGSYVAADVSEAAGAFLTALGGNTYLAALPTNAQITIDVVGKMGVTTPVSGSGTVSSRYKYFDFYSASVGDKRIIFDFGKCERVEIACAASTYNIIFYCAELNIKNATVNVTSSGAGCHVTMMVGNYAGAPISCDNCRLKIIASGAVAIANYGYFTNCSLHVKSTSDHAYCIDQKSGASTRLIGGIYFAYTADASKISSVFNTESTETQAKIMAYNISCPTIVQTGYYQRYLCRSNAGMTYINGVITTLTSTGNASYRQINGQI